MFGYIILIGVPLIWHIICMLMNVKKKNIRNISVILFFTILILLLGLRDISVGTDTKNYIYYYELIGRAPFDKIFVVTETLSSSMEHGFVLLMRLFYMAKAPFNLFLLFCAFVSLFPLMILCYKQSDNPLLVILLFACVSPFTMYFSGIRQAMTMGIGVVAFYFSSKKKLFWFYLTIALSFFIHKTAIALIVLYPLLHLKILKKHLVFVFALSLIILLFGETILKMLLPLLGNYGKYRIMSTGAYRMILLLFIFVVFCFFIPEEKTASTMFYCLRNVLCLCLVLQCFSRHSFVATRVMYFFGIFVPLAIDKSIACSRKQYKSFSDLASISMIAFFFIYFFADTFFGNDGLNIFPYVPFWG